MVYPVHPQAQGEEHLHLEHVCLVCHLMIENQDLDNSVLQVQFVTHGRYHWICLYFQLVHRLTPHYCLVTYL